MFTRDERRALLFLAALAGAGGVVRLVRAGGEPPGAALVATTTGPSDLAAQMARVARAESLAQPLRAGERVNVDAAGPEELERLPGVGPQMAARIVADRNTRGSFGSLAGLDRVPGVGPATLRRLEPWVRFGAVARVTEVQAGQGVAAARRLP